MALFLGILASAFSLTTIIGINFAELGANPASRPSARPMEWESVSDWRLLTCKFLGSSFVLLVCRSTAAVQRSQVQISSFTVALFTVALFTVTI